MTSRFVPLSLGVDTPPTPSSPTSMNIDSACPDMKRFERINQCSELKWLQFKVVSTDGGQYSEEYRCDNMLDNDSSVYCTRKKENTNIVLKIADSSSFVVTHILIKAPELG